MEEDIAIIDKNTRNEKIKNFFINNKKRIIIFISLIILIIFGYFVYGDFKDKKKLKYLKNIIVRLLIIFQETKQI